MSDPYDSLLVRMVPPGGGEALTLPCPADLRFDTVMPGGFKNLSCSLWFPAGTATPRALTALAQVSVVDRRTGSVIWFGELTDPGLVVTPDGQQFSVTAEGAQARADGWREVFGVVDRAQESWQAVGDFSGGSSSFSGDLSPDGDYNLGDYNPGDLVDITDELGIDFGPGIDFGGDTGDFNNIDFNGLDYPKPANYPGYLGYISDPFVDVQIPIGIDLADGSFWNGWEEGWTDTGGSATGGPTIGSLNTGVVTPGPVARKKILEAGLMQNPGYWGQFSPQWTTATADMFFRLQFSFKFRLMAAGSAVRVWMWADATLNGSGYYVEATAAGTVGIYRCTGGASTLLASTTWSPVVGTTYHLDAFPGNSIADIIHTTSPHEVSFIPVLGILVQDATSTTTLANVTWTAPAFDTGTGLSSRYRLITPYPNQPTTYVFGDNLYWGIGAAGSGSVEIESVVVLG